MTTLKRVLLLTSILILFCMDIIHSKCSKIYEKGTNEKTITIIVKKHNYLRSLIANGEINGQPQAKNLVDLRWDKKLAIYAQNIANTCIFEHVKVKDKRWLGIGQNLFLSESTSNKKGPNWNTAIQAWFDEYKHFKYPNTSTGVTGHYTQVVSARSKFVGCGYTMYQHGNIFRKLHVCNYGPGGNVEGMPPYEI